MEVLEIISCYQTRKIMEEAIKFSRLLRLNYDTQQTFFTLTRLPRAGKWGKIWESRLLEQ